MKLKQAWGIVRKTFSKFLEDRALRLSAATAYYAVFSIGPLLVLVVGLAGLVFGEERVRHELARQVESFVGQQPARLIDSMMSARHTGGSLMATIVGGTALVLGAAGVFGQLQDSLNAIWGLATKPGKSIWAFVRNRFFSLAMVLGIGFLLLISMILSALVNAFARYIGALMLVPAWIAPAFNGLASFLVISLLFALIFKVLPDVRIRWRDVWPGAVGTALLFAIGKELLGLYLGREANATAYGAGSAFVVVLLYIYYSSVILYFGAEFTEVYAEHRGSRLEPSRYAVRITDEQRARQGMPTHKQIEEADRRSRRPPATEKPRPRDESNATAAPSRDK